MQLAQHDVVQLLRMQPQRDLVDVVHIHRGDDRLLLDVGKQRDLAPFPLRDRIGSPTHQDVRLDPDRAQFLDRVLGGLGLDLAGCGNKGDQGQVHEQGIVVPQLHAHLANGLEKRQGLDIAHRTADLDQRDVGIARALANGALDLVGDMRDHLHRAAQVVATALLADHVLVDLAGGEVVAPRCPHAHETLVVSQIEVRLRAIVGHEDLAVLERAHGTRIDVDIGVELEQRHLEAARLQDGPQRGGCNAFAQRRNHASGNEYITRHAGNLARETLTPPQKG